MMVGGGEQTALIEAPALADLTRRLYALPPYMLDGRPFAAPPDLYHRALAEFDRVMRDRGWPVLAADIGQANFLFKGVPIVMGDE